MFRFEKAKRAREHGSRSSPRSVGIAKACAVIPNAIFLLILLRCYHSNFVIMNIRM